MVVSAFSWETWPRSHTSNRSIHWCARDSAARCASVSRSGSAFCFLVSFCFFEAAGALACLVLFGANLICSASVSKPNAMSMRLFSAIFFRRSSSYADKSMSIA